MNRAAFLCCVALAGFVCARVVFAGEEQAPPALPDFSVVPTTLNEEPETALLFEGQTIKLEETTLEEVMAMTGAGSIRTRGDGGESQRWLCYVLMSGERVWFVSGELGGSTHVITSIQVTKGDRGRKQGCTRLARSVLSARFANGLWLDSSVSASVARLGRPSAKRIHWWLYSYGGRAGDYDRLVDVGLHFHEGKIDRLVVSQATTN